MSMVAPGGKSLIIDWAGVHRLHARGLGEPARHEGQVGRMASHVSQSSRSIVPPTTPFEGSVAGIVRTHRRRSDKGIPIQIIRNFHGFGRTGRNSGSLGPNRTVGPGVNLLHASQATCLNIFRPFANAVGSGSLVTHLSAKVFFLANSASWRASQTVCVKGF